MSTQPIATLPDLLAAAREIMTRHNLGDNSCFVSAEMRYIKHTKKIQAEVSITFFTDESSCQIAKGISAEIALQRMDLSLKEIEESARRRR